jgi:colanic acid/amylovoran biosynthesis glycosyltransferase
MMRVLHLFEEYLPNTVNWAFRLMDNLPEVQIVIGASRFLKTNFYSTKFQYLEFPIQSLEVRRNGLIEKILRRSLEAATKTYPLYLRRYVGEVDLVHSHFGPVGWAYLPTVLKINAPHIVSFYGWDYSYLPHTQPIWIERYRTLFQMAHRFICEGSSAADKLKGIGCPPEKVKVVRLGVDPHQIPFYRRNKVKNRLDLLQVATLTEKKGHQYTLKAFMQAFERCPNMTLTMVGGDPYWNLKPKLMDILRGSQAEPKVRMIDGIPFEQLHAFMKDFHVFIHPSCHTDSLDCEGGAPVVLLDAQATGMPVIATTHCDIPEVVADGTSGILSEEKNAALLADAITRFYSMGQEEYEGFARGARRHVEERYDIKKNAKVLRDIYQSLVGKRN